MYKSKLQELCQRMSWELPEYRAEREGPDHNPRFIATVTVNGVPFCNQDPCKSSKQAQNDAARLAFEHFTGPDFIRPTRTAVTFTPNAGPFGATTKVVSKRNLPPHMEPPTAANGFSFVPKKDTGVSGLLSATTQAVSRGYLPPHMEQPAVANRFYLVPKKDTGVSVYSSASSGQGSIFATRGNSQPSAQPMHPVPQVNENTSGQKDGLRIADMQHMYKNQLQTYAQKKNLTLPLYSHEREGPPHASIFKCKVTIDGETYESQEFSSTLKEAEHAAAKVALLSLLPDGSQEEDPGLYKNLLQEMAQRESFSLPIYCTSRSGEAHMPSFISTVVIEGESFTGDQAKTKKQAEMSAAKVAYCILKERKPSQILKIPSPVQRGPEADKSSSHVLKSSINAKTSNPTITSGGQAEQSREKYIQSPGGPDTTRNGGSSSSDVSLPSAPSLNECFDSLKINCSTKPPAEMGTLWKSVFVLPRTPNMAIPDDCSVLPISDDDWVAMELRANQA